MPKFKRSVSYSTLNSSYEDVLDEFNRLQKYTQNHFTIGLKSDDFEQVKKHLTFLAAGISKYNALRLVYYPGIWAKQFKLPIIEKQELKIADIEKKARDLWCYVTDRGEPINAFNTACALLEFNTDG